MPTDVSLYVSKDAKSGLNIIPVITPTTLAFCMSIFSDFVLISSNFISIPPYLLSIEK